VHSLTKGLSRLICFQVAFFIGLPIELVSII
jgi:hypothetical protein